MIEAIELIGLRLSSDRKYLRLRVRDKNGDAITISMPACWLNAMLNALPQAAGPDTVHTLDSWSMERSGNGHDLILTLRTPEGQTIAFSMKPWQVQGMATIATYGGSGRPLPVTIH